MHIEISNKVNEIEKAYLLLKEQSQHHSINDNDLKRICIVTDEILTNIITYAFDDDLLHLITIRFDAFQDGCTLEFIDDGKPFNPLHFIQMLPIDNQVDINKNGGIGLRLVQHLTDQIFYNRTDNKNSLTLNLKFAKSSY